jgi:hypothetical protein
MAEALFLSGVESGIVFCGEMGLDKVYLQCFLILQISPSGETHCWTFKSIPNSIKYSILTPETFGLKSHLLTAAVKLEDLILNSTRK